MGGMLFLVKNCEHSVQCGQVSSLITHHEMDKQVERVFEKKITEAECSLS